MRLCLLILLLLLRPVLLHAQTHVSFAEYNLNTVAGNGSLPSGFTTINGKLLFVAETDVSGRELWINDGTKFGIKMLADIAPGTWGSHPEWLFTYNDKVYFAANDNVHGTELWVTDGTAAGTQMIKDLNPGSAPSYPSNFVIYKGQLYFGAEYGNVGSASLWATDGTASGTRVVTDIDSGGLAIDAKCCVADNKLFFIANDYIHGAELWVTDGTKSGTHLVREINPGKGSGGINKPVAFNNRLYFMASAPVYGNELWSSDGTDAGTHMVKDICKSTMPGTNSGMYNIGPVYNGRLYLSANDCSYGPELWSTDGTDSGTYMIKDINTGSLGSSPDHWYVANNMLYFSANTVQSGIELWVTNGTAAGTKQVSDQYKGPGSSLPGQMTTYGGKMYYTCQRDDNRGIQVTVTDGTETGTYQLLPNKTVKDHALYSSSGFVSFHEYNGQLYFAARYNDNGTELWALRDSTVPEHPLSVNSMNKSGTFSIYPNPNNGNFTIQLSGYVANSTNTLTVFDITGRTVHTQKITSENTSISTDNLPKGVYQLMLRQESGVTSGKIVIY